MRLELGQRVRCQDDGGRALVDVVIDPSTKSVTHLVVGSEQRPEAARLVPITLVGGSDDSAITLLCDSATFEKLEAVREYADIESGEQIEEEGKWDVGVEDYVPNPSLQTTGLGEPVGAVDPYVGVFYDRVPKGEVELRNASAVYSADEHHVGHVGGLMLDQDGAVKHLLVKRGHFWWRREIAIPVDAVSTVETDMVTLAVPKDDLARLPRARDL
jgi:sporulation protein YlmC with PRC-barrel domain